MNKKKIPNSACIPKLTKFRSNFFTFSNKSPKNSHTSRTTIHHFLSKANKHLNVNKIAIFLTLNNNTFLTFHSNYYPIPLPNSPTSSSSHLLYQPSTKSLSSPHFLPQNQKIPSAMDRTLPYPRAREYFPRQVGSGRCRIDALGKQRRRTSSFATAAAARN